MVVELRHVGFRVGVILVPLHARGHGQQLADADVVVGRALHLRDVVADLVVHAPDGTVAQCRTHQRRCNGLGHGEAGPAPFAVKVQPVALQTQLAIVQHDQRGAALAGQVSVHVQRQLQRRPRRQGRRRVAGRDVVPLGQQRDAVQGAEGRVALRLAPEQQVFVGGDRGNQAPGFLVQAEPAGRAGDGHQGERTEGDFLELHWDLQWAAGCGCATNVPERRRFCDIPARFSIRDSPSAGARRAA
ncbi:MAG: hypothetical protein BWX79_02879 [Alphaproteobacteria bacterium ADurb.Bin100]|nr:MAG: hypothetical protein BWX79_02879 [Alphaproteobacteria bacterium ADurb.Bin100]